MLRIQMIGLALVSVIAMSALAAGSASAAEELHQWLLIHDLAGGGQVHLLLSKPEKVLSEGTVELEDTKAGTGTKVKCSGFNTGTIGPHGLDLVETITLELSGTKKAVSCTFVKNGGLCTSAEPTAEAVNLPWHTQLILRGGQVRDLILGHGAGKPGWAVTCTNIIGGKTTDTCEEEAGNPNSTLIENIPGVGVRGKFNEAEGPPAKCSVGGAGTGKVNGSVTTLNASSTLLVAVSFGP
jgi:hypothetical protein